MVKVFTTEELVSSLTDIGFQVDHQWQPAEGKAAFIVVRKTIVSQ